MADDIHDGPGWDEVRKAMNEGRPQTAIEKLEPIIARATQQNDHPEAIKAIALKIELEGSIREDQPDLRIRRMQAAIEAAPAEMHPVMDAILARWMWQFFQEHQWQFMERTTVAPGGLPDDDNEDAASGDQSDMLTWDLRRILRAIDQQFTRSLAQAEKLQAIPVDSYKQLLSIGSVPQEYRPTLYDVLVHHALDFYSSDEQAGLRSSFAFQLKADSPIFASQEEFLRWMPETQDKRAPLWVAVKLYQDLLRFHTQAGNATARLDVDLARLEFGHHHAVGEEKNQRYAAALLRFESANAAHSLSSMALAELATLRHREGDFKAAHEIANQGLARFPESLGAIRCSNLIKQIEAREAASTTERVWNDPWPTIDVRYRNVSKVFFRLVKFDFDEFVSSGRWQPEALEQDHTDRLLAMPIIKAWSADLPATEDFKTRLHRVDVPKDVPYGSYFLISSHREDFQKADNQLSLSEVWVSTLGIVTQSRPETGYVGGLVVEAKSGTPIAGAVVRAWHRSRRNVLVELQAVRTDNDGRFEFPPQERQQLILLVTHRDQRLSSAGALSTYMQREVVVAQEQTRFFTDRAIYRPGQTIQYKGICLSANETTDSYVTLPNRKVTLVFTDPNGKEIQRQDHESNGYGSFSGSFVAPRDRLTGRMILRVESGPSGYATVQVEEYKRPKFEVELSSPIQPARLGGEVAVGGSATAFTGAAIDNGTVSWRVVREVRFPPWWYWRSIFPPSGESQEIASGTAQTSANGTFEIRFDAIPDAKVLPESEPTFQYKIYADVTDSAGETRSTSRTVSLGYTALTASLAAGDWLEADKPLELKVQTSSLGGEGQSAQGTLKIHALKQPESVGRSPLSGTPLYQDIFDNMPWAEGELPPQRDPNDMNQWELDEVVFETAINTDGSGKQTVSTKLPAGAYRAVLKSRDAFGKEVTAMLPLTMIDAKSGRFPIKIANHVSVESESLSPGKSLRAIWGSGYAAARAFVEIEHRGRVIKRYWTPQGRTQVMIDHPVTEEQRGGFTLRVTMVRENRAYMVSRQIDVPWTNKELSIKWERFVSKLQPGQKETWTAVISGDDAQRVAAEMVATLYDASLDVFKPHQWIASFNVFREDRAKTRNGFENRSSTMTIFHRQWEVALRAESWTYPHLDWPPSQRFGRVGMYSRGRAMRGMVQAESEMMMDAMPMSAAPFGGMGGMGGGPDMPLATKAFGDADDPFGGQPGEGESTDGRNINLEGITARKNLQETAFFFPHVVASGDGVVRLEFTMPEALTRWQFFGFAHDRNLRSGLLSDTAVSSKDLMVQPNPPRFLREGDQIEFTVKVTNQSPTRQSGAASLRFSDMRTGDSVDTLLGNTTGDQSFDLAAGQSQTLAWKIAVADGLQTLTYRAVASTGRLSDGEEGFLPVLPRRILVTESLPLPIRGKQTRTFDFAKLGASAGSETLSHQSLTVQMTSNPSWYAVMALPYLMEYPHQCSEQIFNRLYANALAHHIATSDPKIERVFEQWRATKTLDSPLMKNNDLKAVLTEETPWFRQAQSESEARRNVGILFDQNRLDDETNRALNQLAEQQLEDGRWPWFPGGIANDFITLYITTGFGRLRHLGVQVDTSSAIDALSSLDAWMDQMYARLSAGKDFKAEDHHLTHTVALYLYGRSFFLRDQPIAPEFQPALTFWLDQAKRHWLKLGSLQLQANLAVAMKRFDIQDVASQIMVSIKERSVNDDEMGMHWPKQTWSQWWYQAPIESQAAIIEAFDEVMNDKQAVEDCKVWLLKQKQTQDWETTKATADAIYSLLLRGSDLLASTRLVDVEIGGTLIKPIDAEAGTGFFQQRKVGGEVSADMSKIRVTKHDEGVAWGSVHWQYFEDIDRVTPSGDNPLKLTKELYVKTNTPEGPVLKRVAGEVNVGDELVVRLVLRTDRDLEFVHIRDHRGSGTEPTNVLSGYRWRDGLGYYESTRDTASHFFVDFMRQGTYVFEYSTRVQLRGEYQTGMAMIQCMYAPEFNSHSETIRLTVGP